MKDVAAYILAGGQSQRFGGKPKGLELLDGIPLIEHVITRLRPQVSSLHINSSIQDYQCFNLPIVSDRGELFSGPLAGLYAAMQHMHEHAPKREWLMLSACDTPFIPDNVVALLYESISNKRGSCICYQNELQPTLSLWHKSLLQEIESAVTVKKWGGLKQFIKSLGDDIAVVSYPEIEGSKMHPFFNINCANDLQQAQELIEYVR